MLCPASVHHPLWSPSVLALLLLFLLMTSLNFLQFPLYFLDLHFRYLFVFHNVISRVHQLLLLLLLLLVVVVVVVVVFTDNKLLIVRKRENAEDIIIRSLQKATIEKLGAKFFCISSAEFECICDGRQMFIFIRTAKLFPYRN